MGPDETLLWAQLGQIDPQQAAFISQAYVPGSNGALFTNGIIGALWELGIPITQLGIENAQRMAMNAVNPQKRAFTDPNGDGTFGGLADFRIALIAGAKGIIYF